MANRPTSNSQSFTERADSAAFWEAHVGATLARGGLYTVHHPFTLAQETGRSLESYGDSWDLDVATASPSSLNWAPERVEVKSLNLTFYSPEDYPFPKAMVCSQKSFLKKWPGSNRTGRHFLFVSRETGKILWLPAGSAVELGHEALDRTRNESYKVVKTDRSSLCPLESFVAFMKEPWPSPRDSNPEE